MTTAIRELRSKRLAAEIPSTLLPTRSGINRPRLSCIEHRYLQPTEDEVHRVEHALAELLYAKSLVQRAADGVG